MTRVLVVFNPASGGAEDDLHVTITALLRPARRGLAHLRGDPQIEFNVDGEFVGLTSPAIFEIADRVRFLVPR